MQEKLFRPSLQLFHLLYLAYKTFFDQAHEVRVALGVVGLTVLVGEHGRADGTGPHPEAGRELRRHLGVAGQVLPQAALVHVELPAHRAGVICVPPLGCN